MNTMIRWLTIHPVAANLAMVFLILAGVVSALGITQKTFPSFSLEVINVSVSYPGASPREIEQSIIRPIEDQLSAIDGIDEVRSTAVEGRGSVSLSLQLGEDAATALDEIKGEVDRITLFPDDATEPVVVQASQRERALELTLHGDTTERVLKEQAERLKDELVRLPGVSFVQLGNVRADEITIEVDRHALAAYGLSMQDIAQRISANSLELPGGAIDSDTLSIPLRTLGRNLTGADYSAIILLSDDSGGKLRLGDIARIDDGFETSDLAARFNAQQSVSVNVFRIGSEQVLEIVDQTRTYLRDEFEPTLPEGLNVSIWQNDAQELQGRLDLLIKNAALGLALVMLCLTLFLDFRLAFWSAAGIGVAFLATFIVMSLAGMSINMISLFGFILAIGIVVDNAIVIGENVYTQAESGLDSTSAAIAGTQRMAVPVIFSALTTVVAFTPLLQLPGILGKFLGDIPTVVIIVLLLSLLQSLFILPRNLSSVNFSAHYRPNIVLRILGRVRHVIDKALRWFIEKPLNRMLVFSTKQWAIPLACVLALMILTVGVIKYGYVKFSFFPSIEGSYITADIEMVDGSSFSLTQAMTERVQVAAMAAGEVMDSEFPALPAPAVVGVNLVAGTGAATTGPNGGPGKVGANMAHVVVQLIDPELRTFSSSEFESRWREKLGVLTGLKRLNLSSSVVNAGEPIALEFSLPDGRDIAPLIDEVTVALGNIAGVFDIRDDASAGRPEFSLMLKEEAVAYGLTVSDLAMQLRHGFFGIEATRVQRGNDDVRVYVKLPDYQRTSIADLLSMKVRSATGANIPLSTVATIIESRSPSEILRRDGRTITTLSADVDFATVTAQEANSYIRESILPELTARHPGLIVDFGGEQRTQGDAGAALGKAFAGAMFVIFALLALIFRSYVQPLVVMMAIPLGLIGAVTGHLLVGIPLGLLSIFGIIGLSGVVINNSLVMVDLYNEYLQKGYGTRRAVIEGTKDRFRPILLTSLTTFLGVYPLIAETSQQAQFLIPLAVSIGYGVLFGTLIIILSVPALFIAQSKLFRTYLADFESRNPTDLSFDKDDYHSTQGTLPVGS